MFIRLAEKNDMNAWREVANDVAEIFGHATMADDPEFINYAEKKITQKEAATAVDCETGECFGFIGFSRDFNRITWLAVLEKNRNKGAGSKLLQFALNELDSSKEITVDTFRENFVHGKPARHFYFKHGFIEINNSLLDNLGNERCQLALAPA